MFFILTNISRAQIIIDKLKLLSDELNIIPFATVITQRSLLVVIFQLNSLNLKIMFFCDSYSIMNF